MMLLRCGLLLLFLSCMNTTGNIHENGIIRKISPSFDETYSYWPSVHNAARLIAIRKREVQKAGQEIQSEGGVQANPQVSQPLPGAVSADKGQVLVSEPAKPDTKNETAQSEPSKDEPPKVEDTKVPVKPPLPTNETVTPPVANNNDTKTNVTQIEAKVQETPNQLDLNKPGVLKRGLIVFGGFALLALAYFAFYRKKSSKNDGLNNNTADTNQFRYGVLLSEDSRDKLEFSRVPLTMESDDDEDEDLEIFDLEQKKKSLSYVNLQTNDDEPLHSATESSRTNERDNLLLDIEDGSSDTLINWSNNGNKSIL